MGHGRGQKHLNEGRAEGINRALAVVRPQMKTRVRIVATFQVASYAAAQVVSQTTGQDKKVKKVKIFARPKGTFDVVGYGPQVPKGD